jgi:hypothetical protein
MRAARPATKSRTAQEVTMNRSIGKWIRIGLFAALSSGGVALAQSSQQSDTGASGTPPIVSPSDRDNMQNKKDLDEDVNLAPTDKAGSSDIHRTRGTNDEKQLPDTTTEEQSNTTIKKQHHKRSQGRTGNKVRKSMDDKSIDDKSIDTGSKRSNDIDMQDKSNLNEKNDVQPPDLTK